MYKKKYSGWLKHWDFMVIDLICIQLSFCIAYILKFGFSNPYSIQEYRNLAEIFLLVDLFVTVVFDSFKNILKKGWYLEFGETIKHVFIVEAITLFYLFTVQNSDIYSRMTFYLMIPVYILISYTGRCLWKVHLQKSTARTSARTIIIVASNTQIAECLKDICGMGYNGYRCAGLVTLDKDASVTSISGIPIVATVDTLTDYVCKEWVDEIFIFPQKNDSEILKITDELNCMGITTHIAIAKSSNEHNNTQLVEKISSYTYITNAMNNASPLPLLAKRFMDICGGIIGCLITLVLIIIIGPVIYFASPGPIFFSQKRIGRNGRKFKMYKFRSMYMDAEERKKELMSQNKVGDGMMFKMDFDPRIIGNKVLPNGKKKTGIGQFIRKTSLDEFPQFWNILKGDMSLVGTRPPTLDEWEKYEPHHRARMAFRPGLTGLWQVSGRSNITDFEEVVKLDTEYINEWDLGLDIKIILKTITSVSHDDGAM